MCNYLYCNKRGGFLNTECYIFDNMLTRPILPAVPVILYIKYTKFCFIPIKPFKGLLNPGPNCRPAYCKTNKLASPGVFYFLEGI